MKRVFQLLICGVFAFSYSNQAVAQMFDADEQWEDDERTILTQSGHNYFMN